VMYSDRSGVFCPSSKNCSAMVVLPA
jgi:hypothetical protein